MNNLSFAFLASLTLLLGAGVAHAQPTDAPAADSAGQAEPSVAITVSPLHLFVPMAEVTVEARVAPRFGVAVIAGVGQFHVQTSNERIDLFEGGASARYYATGSFRTGLQLGAEAIYVHASTTDMSVDIKARGLGLSPFLGYKWTHSSGFTFEGQLGASYMTARASSATASAGGSKIGPMLNLNVGWSL